MSFTRLWIMGAALFFCSAGTKAYPDPLLFIPGTKKTFEISQQVNYTRQGAFEETGNNHSIAIVDVEILSVEPGTFGYPIDVEVTIKKINIQENINVFDEVIAASYDSEDKEDGAFESRLKSLLNCPLRFRIHEDFKAIELTSILTKAENEDCAFSFPLAGSQSSFNVLLTLIFHLSGKEMMLGQSYPVNCYQFVNWEDEELDQEECQLNEKSDYVMSSMDHEKIQAVWRGNATIKHPYHDALIKVESEASWQKHNALEQERSIAIKVNERVFIDFFGVIMQKMFIAWEWKSI